MSTFTKMVLNYNNWNINLLGVHDSANPNSEGSGWHLRNVPPEEARVGDDGFLSQSLHTGTRHQTRAWLIERYMAIWTNAWSIKCC